MNIHLMKGFWRYMINVPPSLWKKEVSKHERKVEANLAFMSDDHRRVHHWVVKELPTAGKPLSPKTISERLGLPENRVAVVLDDLEKNMTFLFRNDAGHVIWAYPVTVEKTPHHLTFSSGEQIYAAWAADAFATPFVQGRLRKESLSVVVKTECAHCSEPMTLDIDSKLNCKVRENGADPLIFIPDVKVDTLEDPSIIEAFWKQSVFFQSEEHAREYRRKGHRVRGAYFNTEQMTYLTRVMQSALFGFWKDIDLTWYSDERFL